MTRISKQGEACNAIYGELAPESASCGPAHNPRRRLPGGGNAAHKNLTGEKTKNLGLLDQFEARPNYGVLSDASGN
jgi:hypothetical protein